MLREHFTMIWMNKESMNRSFENLWMQVPECLIHRWIWQKIFSQKDVVHFCASQNFAVIWVWNHPGRHRTALHMEPSKLYPCHYKTSFVLTRVTCRLLCNGANKFAVSLRERGRINECWICKLSSLGTSVLRCNERIKDCLINRMSSVQSSAYICFSRQWFKFFMLDGTLDFGQMNWCVLYWT